MLNVHHSELIEVQIIILKVYMGNIIRSHALLDLLITVPQLQKE